MNFIRHIGWLDPWPLTVWLYRNQALLREQQSPGLRSVTIMDGPSRISGFDKMATLKITLGRARRIAEAGNFEVTDAELQQLDPSAGIPWRWGDDRLAVHIGLVCNPNATLYCGGEAWVLWPGQVVAYNEKVQHSAVNAGETPRISLVLKLRQREQEEA